MKHLLLTTIAAVVLVGCGESQQSAPTPELKPIARVAGAKAPDISIHDAANKGNIEAVKEHLAAGTEVDAKNKSGSLPLHIAAEKGHKEIVELLIANGANVEARESSSTFPINENGGIPLHNAASSGHLKIAELIISKGANVNAKDGDGYTPLHYCAFWGWSELSKLLIIKGADVNARSNIGKTPLDEIIEGTKMKSLSVDEKFSLRDLPATADLLRKHGGKTGEELKAEGK